MPDLGELGQAPSEEEDVTFGMFGQQIRVNPGFGELELVDFMEAAAAVDVNSAASFGLLKDLMRSMVHPDDFDMFWMAAKRHRQGVEDLMKIAHAVIEQATARPTGLPADSSDGQQATAESSTDDFSTRVIRRLEAQGRPDLAAVALNAAEAKAG